MDAGSKKILRALSLELRHILEGAYDAGGKWHPGDLDRRLNEIGIWRDRDKPLNELPHLSAEDKAARKVVEAYLKLRDEAGVLRSEAVAEFVRESAYTWANRLFALRCMEARVIIDEVILQKDAYGGRSLVHNRFAKKNPDACVGQDDGLFAVLFEEFAERSEELPGLFNPNAPAVALRPSVAALKKCIALLSGRENVKGQDAATDAVFESHDAFGWAYQYWNTEEKDRVFEKVRTEKGAKIEGSDIIPATQLYTEPYMVKFLVHNSLGALWMGMHPESQLSEQWEYFVKDADRAPVDRKPVSEITMLDPAIGSGHFHLEAFDLFYAMYEEEGVLTTPEAIAASILNNNLFGIDIDERAIQIATAALWMKAKQKAPNLQPADLTTFHDHLVATNIRLPKGKNHLESFLKKHPDDAPLRSALETVFDGLQNAHEIGSLLQIEEPVEKQLRDLQNQAQQNKGKSYQEDFLEKVAIQGEFPVGVGSYDQWKTDTLLRLKEHFHAEAEASDLGVAFFGQTAAKGLLVLDALSKRYDVVALNPPYFGAKKMGTAMISTLRTLFPDYYADTYTAFIKRSSQMLTKSGRFGIVCRDTWTYQKNFERTRKDFITSSSFELWAQLGSGAFSESLHSGVSIGLFVVVNKPAGKGRFLDVRASQSVLDKVAALSRRTVTSVFDMRTFERLPLTAFLADAPSWALSILASVNMPTLLGVLPGTDGTVVISRFTRFNWEVGAFPRWRGFSKGGGFKRWTGLDFWVVDWRTDGNVIEAYALSRYPKEKLRLVIKDKRFVGQPGVTYTSFANYSIGARRFRTGYVSSNRGPCYCTPNARVANSVLGYLNSIHGTRLTRMISPSVEFGFKYVGSLPLPTTITENDDLSKVVIYAEELAGREICDALNERYFDIVAFQQAFASSTLSEFMGRYHAFTNAAGAMKLTCTQTVNRLVSQALGLNETEIVALYASTGYPAGTFHLIAGYDTLPDVGQGVPIKVQQSLASTVRRQFSQDELQELNNKLKSLFSCNSSLPKEEDDHSEESIPGEEDGDDIDRKSSIPIPQETTLERCAVELRIHPLSLYWLLKEGIEKEGWRCIPEEQRLTGDRFTVIILRLLGHRWPKQIEASEPTPDWADKDGVIPINDGTDEKTVLERARERITAEFPGGNVQSIENEFQKIMGETLANWLTGSFFKRHVSQFKKRPISWQIESQPVRSQDDKSRKRATRSNGAPAFSCLVYYHKLNADLLPKIRTQYVGSLITKAQTEQRTLERMVLKTDDQDARKWELQNKIDELKAFDDRLSQVAANGFITGSLRQYAIDDATLQLKSRWLEKLRETCRQKQLKSWQELAKKSDIHADLPTWIAEAIEHLPHHCSSVSPQPPDEKKLKDDPATKELAAIICVKPAKTVREALTLACEEWWKRFDEVVLLPLKQQVKDAKTEQVHLEGQLEQTEPPLTQLQQAEIKGEIKALKAKIKKLREEIEALKDAADKLRKQIIGWKCDDAENWESWLAKQPLYDQVSALSGKKPVPKTVADWTAQESLYAPDINDGVRVNIAPIQKAGLLAADVLAGKELDKAIADRAEWRSDERRWVREGKLPQPGWW